MLPRGRTEAACAQPDQAPGISKIWQHWRLRNRRRYLLLRALRRRRRHLTARIDRTANIGKGQILLFATIRNEAHRLPYFLEHYRKLGVDHFLFVDNDSRDGSTDFLASQPDTSVWTTTHSYKRSRFGMDWINGLLQRHGHGHWCLTVDADELLIYPHWQTRPLPALTDWLEGQEIESFGAMMLDLYPKGPIDQALHRPGDDPASVMPWFDAGNHVMRKQEPLGNLWIQGGVRARHFFTEDPRRAPTLGKVPLVRWHWRYAYVSSTHSLLPRHLNDTHDRQGGERISGILLHTKFLDSIVEKSAEEKQRQEHFANSRLYDRYYDSLIQAPDLWCDHSTRYQGWRHLEALGLMSRGGWA